VHFVSGSLLSAPRKLEVMVDALVSLERERSVAAVLPWFVLSGVVAVTGWRTDGGCHGGRGERLGLGFQFRRW